MIDNIKGFIKKIFQGNEMNKPGVSEDGGTGDLDKDKKTNNDRSSPKDYKIMQGIADSGLILKKEIGEGQFGKVYLVYDPSQNMEFAMKQMHTPNEKENQHKFLSILLNDCKTQIKLGLHPNIANCYYARRIGQAPYPYIFMEYADEGSLDEWIKEGRIHSITSLLCLSYQMAVGLHFIHTSGYIHQDIKPKNILMRHTDDGTPLAKIADFGLSSELDKDGYGLYRGRTREFASPEQCSKEQKITLKADMWGWAATVLKMYRSTIYETWQDGRGAPNYLESYYHNDQSGWIPMPRAFYELLNRCFERDPQNRPKDMDEIAKSIKAIFKDEIKLNLPEINVKSAILSAIGYNNQAVSYFNIGAYEEVIPALRKALDSKPDHMTAIYNLGLILWAGGVVPDDMSLVHAIENMMGDQQDKGYCYYLMGRAHIHRLQPEKAIAALEESIRLKSDHLPTQRFLDYLTQNERIFPHKVATLRGHTGEVECVNISYDGSRAISFSKDRTVRVWDLNTNECICAWDTPLDLVFSVSLSADGTVAAATGFDKDGIAIWDVDEYNKLATLEIPIKENHYVHIDGVVFHPHLPYLISSDETRHDGLVEGNLRIWDIKSGECVKKIHGAHKDRIFSLTISSDSNFLVTSGRDNTVKTWQLFKSNPGIDIISKDTVQGARRYADPENAPSQDPDSIYFADMMKSKLNSDQSILYASRDGAIHLYDLKSEKIVSSFHGHSDTPYCVRWIRDTPFAISASVGEIKLWDVSNRTCITTYPTKTIFISSRFGLAGNNLIIASGDDIEVWTVEKIKSISLDSKMLLNNRIMLDNGLLFDSIKNDNAAKRIKDSEMLEAHISQIENLHREGYSESAYQALKTLQQKCPGFKRHALVRQMAVEIGFSGYRNGVEDIWLDSTLSWKDNSTGSNLSGLDVSKDNRTAIAVSYDGVIMVSDIASKMIHGILHSNDSAHCIRFAGPDKALTGVRGGVVNLWKLDDLERLDLFELNNQWNAINELDYCDKTGHVAFTAGSILGGSLIVYDLSTKEILLEQKSDGLSLLQAQFSSICLSADGRLLLAGEASGKISLWDISQRRRILTIKGHLGQVKYLKFYQSGMSAISAGEDNIIRFWDLKFARCIKSIKYEPGNIECICLVSDESYLIVLDNANTISMWNLRTFKCDKRIKPDIPIQLSLIGITPNGQYIVTGGEDRTICTFGIEWGYDFSPAIKDLMEREPRKLHLPDGSLIEPSLGLGHSSDISALAVSDLRYLISGSFDCRVKVWDIFRDGICINTLEGHGKKINAILASSFRDQIITASDDETVIIWGFGSGLMQQTLKHSAPVNALAINQAWDILVTGCEDGSVLIWNLKAGMELQTAEEKGRIETLLITSDDKYLVIGTGQGDVIIRSFPGMENKKIFNFGNGIISRVLENREKLYVGCASGSVKIIDLAKLELIEEMDLYEQISDMYVSGSNLIICDSKLTSSAVKAIDMVTGDLKAEIKNIGWIRAIADYFLNYCFIGLGYGYILMADITSGKIAALISAVDDSTLCTKISSDRHFLISGHNSSFRLWNLYSGELNEFNMPNIIDLDFSSDGRFAYFEDYSGRVYQLELETKQITKEFGYSSLGNLNAVTFTHGFDGDTFESNKFTIAIRNEDGIICFEEIRENELSNFQDKEIDDKLRNSAIRYITTSSLRSRGFSPREEIILLDMYKKNSVDQQITLELDKMAGMDYDKVVEKAIISWDSGLLIAKHLDSIVRVWNIETKELIQTITNDEKDSSNLGIVALYNNNILIAGYSNGKIKLWNLNTAELLKSFDAHSGPVSSISTSPDRNLIISSSRGDGIKIWSFDDFRLIASILKINATDYSFTTSNDGFYVSDPKYLQFYQIRGANDIKTRTLIYKEECREKYLRYFIDIKLIRAILEIKQ